MHFESYPWARPSFPWSQTTDNFAPPAVPSRDDDIRAVLKDFARYRKFLKIRPRTGGERVPFELNAAQVVLDSRLTHELENFGRVRAAVPKARRMGVSTYIGGRYFHKVATNKGRRAHVVAHRSDSAANLHREIKLFCEGLPAPWRPSTGASNSRELIFDRLQSVYKVSSAEGGDIGRSDDTHYLHLSEVGFSDNTEEPVIRSHGNGTQTRRYRNRHGEHRQRCQWHVL